MAPQTGGAEERAKSRRVGALRGLIPFLAPYRMLIALAGFALVATAAVSLVLPLAVRRVVDGFMDGAELLDAYFAAALGVAALLALGTGARFYL
ncbi:MAG: ABC transporter, partial [Gemmobacter sp.]